jgi:hypothetical protein
VLAGAGDYPEGTEVTVTATTAAAPPPFVFRRWSENNVTLTAEPVYVFALTKNRDLVAHYELQSFAVTAVNDPVEGGRVTGTGVFPYDTTHVLEALPFAGYLFDHWTEDGIVIGLDASFTNIVRSNRLVVAHYAEANPQHVVTTATLPPGLAPVTGAGTYLNGETAQFEVPAAVTKVPNVYSFRRFTLNGSYASGSPTYSKTFRTADPANLAVVAEYESRPLAPVIVEVFGSVTNAALGGFIQVTNPAPALTNYQLVLRFDRAMKTAPEPRVVLTNTATGWGQLISNGGTWSSSQVARDTYRTVPIVLGAAAHGTNWARVSQAEDTYGVALT